MKAEKNVILREIAGEYILIPTGELALQYPGIFALSELGVAIWGLLQENMSEEEIIAALLEEYEVDEETLRTDVAEFLQSLREKKLLTDE